MGTTVIMGPWENGVDAQLWFEDRNSQIRHKTSDKVLDAEGLLFQQLQCKFTDFVFNDVTKLGGKDYSDKNTPNCTQTEISRSKFIYDQVQRREEKGEEEQI